MQVIPFGQASWTCVYMDRYIIWTGILYGQVTGAMDRYVMWVDVLNVQVFTPAHVFDMYRCFTSTGALYGQVSYIDQYFIRTGS